ncbi:hypothetical protein LguiA_015150 [Lonicera macranthoides]
MERGWGLTLDSSDRFFVSGLNPRLNHAKSGMFSGNGFPVNLNYKEEPAGSPPVDDNRVAMSEVDFFSSKPNEHVDSKINNVIVKKENSRNDATPMNDLNVNTGLHLLTAANTGSDQSTVDDGISSNGDDTRSKNKLAQLQIELEKMNTENMRLRGMLAQVTNNYSSLQMQMVTIMQQQQNSATDGTQQHKIIEGKLGDKKDQVRQFIDLGPSRAPETDEASNNTTSEERTQSGSPINAAQLVNNRYTNETIGSEKEKASLRDDKRIAREESPESESWAPNKVPKLVAAKAVDQATEATMRKARVSVRARSEAPMITDGCQWRKYGQKMAKGNPCPRAYYRCTMAVGCPVRKQVQRCAEDRTILITTYEGTHNHPLPPAAMAMASTTSAAANMLLSGSMSSADGIMNHNFLARAIFPSNSSMATISASAPFPTVTLDLTHSPNPLQMQRAQSQSQSHFQVPSQLPQVFGQPLHNQSQFSGLQLSQNMDSSQLAHQGQPSQPQSSFADTLSAATAAITADPNFTAALAAAISSIMGGSQTNNNNNNNSSNNNSHKNSSFTGN